MGMMSRPGLLNLGSRHHFEVATWVDSVRSQPGLEVATWPRLSRPGHCSGHCSGTLFMNTVHRVKKRVQKF